MNKETAQAKADYWGLGQAYVDMKNDQSDIEVIKMIPEAYDFYTVVKSGKPLTSLFPNGIEFVVCGDKVTLLTQPTKPPDADTAQVIDEACREYWLQEQRERK